MAFWCGATSGLFLRSRSTSFRDRSARAPRSRAPSAAPAFFAFLVADPPDDPAALLVSCLGISLSPAYCSHASRRCQIRSLRPWLSRMADAVYQSPALLVFVHIPKTAGTTLRGILNMNEPGGRSRALSNVFKGGGGLSTASLERLRDGNGPDIKSGVRLVRGHFPLGIREYLPKERELRCFTFLREPAERTLSHYYAIRAVGGAYRLPPLPPDSTLDDALAAGYIHDNLHTRMLCGDPEPFGEVTEEMLAQAKRNLAEELVFFGLTERFDESLVLAKRRLGLKAILYRSSGRVNPERPRGDQIPAEVRRAAERCNRYDIELYRHAKDLFEQALEPRDLEFEVDLAALRAAKTGEELEVRTPVPASFGGDEEAWGMLVRAAATAEELQQKLAGVSSRAASDRARTRVLKREVERREAAPERMVELEEEVERLRPVAARAVELEREVKRLRGASVKADEGGAEVEQISSGTPDQRAKRDGRKGARTGAKRAGSKPGKAGAKENRGVHAKPDRGRSKRERKPRRRKPRREPALVEGDGASNRGRDDEGG